MKQRDISWSFVRCQIALSKSTSTKILQKLSVIKTNTSDDIKKIVHFGILVHILSWKQNNTSVYYDYWEFLTSFWRDNWRSLIGAVENFRFCASKNLSTRNSLDILWNQNEPFCLKNSFRIRETKAWMAQISFLV